MDLPAREFVLMSALSLFLEALLAQGRMHLDEPLAPGPDADSEGLLRRMHGLDGLNLAGPALPFVPEVALAAAQLVHEAAWLLLHPELALAPEALPMPAPRGAADHLSADLTLRYLPAVHRRALARQADEGLAVRLAEVLRQWPLSGVLSKILEAPRTPVDFEGHAGLSLLYAERLVPNERAAWFPGGPVAAYVELVYQDLGKDLSKLPYRQQVAAELALEEPV